jgi:arsenate reductase (thioredoxin)
MPHDCFGAIDESSAREYSRYSAAVSSSRWAKRRAWSAAVTEARSAGSQPGESTHPVVLEALEEVGIDASDHVPAKLDDQHVQWADVIVATCDDSCPYIPGKRCVSWRLPDPKGRPLGEVRRMRDDIAARVTELANELDAA